MNATTRFCTLARRAVALCAAIGLSIALPATAEDETTVMGSRIATLPQLVLALFNSVEQIADYKFPASYPRVHRVNHAALERVACGGNACWAVKAAYVRAESALYVDSALDLQENILDRSVLLHELVHHMQNLTQRYADLPPCQRYRIEEREAFEIQNAHLAQFTPRHYIPFNERMYQCEEPR